MNKEREVAGLKVFVSGNPYNEYKGTLQEQIKELEKELKEADEAVEYWQKECDKRSKVIDKIKEIMNTTPDTNYSYDYVILKNEIYKVLEEIE